MRRERRRTFSPTSTACPTGPRRPSSAATTRTDRTARSSGMLFRSWPRWPGARPCAARCSASVSTPALRHPLQLQCPVVHRKPRREGRQRPHHPRARTVEKTFRDTWRDGVHSHLGWLRDRLTAERELPTKSGSVFVQTGDENVNRARALMDEIFGDASFIGEVIPETASGAGSPGAGTPRLASTHDLCGQAQPRKPLCTGPSDPGVAHAHLEGAGLPADKARPGPVVNRGMAHRLAEQPVEGRSRCRTARATRRRRSSGVRTGWISTSRRKITESSEPKSVPGQLAPGQLFGQSQAPPRGEQPNPAPSRVVSDRLPLLRSPAHSLSTGPYCAGTRPREEHR